MNTKKRISYDPEELVLRKEGGDANSESLLTQVDDGIATFMSEHGELIESACEALISLDASPEGAQLKQLIGERLRSGAGPESSDATVLATQLLLDNENLAGVFNKAYKQGMRGLGLGGDAEYFVPYYEGQQVGAEGLVQFPYRVGTYKTPAQVKYRYWKEVTRGSGLGASAALGLTFFLVPPMTSERVFGFYTGYLPFYYLPRKYAAQRVAGVGARLEFFSWLPETEDGSVQGGKFHPITAIWKAIFGFRISVTVGFDLIHAISYIPSPWQNWYKWTRWVPEAGTYRASYQFVSDALLTLPRYNLLPTAIEKDNTGNTLVGTVSAPLRGKDPARVFRTADSSTGREASTMKITFPAFMTTAIGEVFQSGGATFTIDSTGSGATQHYEDGYPTTPWSFDKKKSGSSKFVLEWVGKDCDAWGDEIAFTLGNANPNSGAVAPQYGYSKLTLTGIDSQTSLLNVTISLNASSLSLVETLFKADVTGTLTIDSDYADDFKIAWIAYNDPTDTTQWTYVDDPKQVQFVADNGDAPISGGKCRLVASPDSTEDDPIVLALIPPADKSGTVLPYYCGYVFQQTGASEEPQCQIRAVLWKIASMFVPANYYAGGWQTLNTETTKTSTAEYDGSYYGSAIQWQLAAIQTYPTSTDR